MIFFVILTILFIAARVTVSFFEVVPAAACTALTLGCVISGIIAGVFIGIEIYKKLKK